MSGYSNFYERGKKAARNNRECPGLKIPRPPSPYPRWSRYQPTTGITIYKAVASFSVADAKVSDHLLSVTNDSVTGVSRANPQSSEKYKVWNIKVDPSGKDAVSISVPATTDYSAAACSCMSDNRNLAAAGPITANGP